MALLALDLLKVTCPVPCCLSLIALMPVIIRTYGNDGRQDLSDPLLLLDSRYKSANGLPGSGDGASSSTLFCLQQHEVAPVTANPCTTPPQENFCRPKLLVNLSVTTTYVLRTSKLLFLNCPFPEAVW